jgi:type II secretory pathway pseudopilin PulG
MKYKTFRNLVMVGAIGLAGVSVWQISSCLDERAAAEQALADRRNAYAEQIRQQQANRPVFPPSRLAADPNLQTIPSLGGGRVEGHDSPEAYLIATLGKPANTDKLKDVTNGAGSKINVYNEGGTWARAKVDHDRDEKWDESWHVDSGAVVRRIAPDDDEMYTRELRNVGGAWAEIGGAAATPTTDPTPPTPTDSKITSPRDCDTEMLRLIASAAVEEKIKDATKGKPYKINLYSDDKVRWNRAKIDLDRDDKFDEKWDFKSGDVIERQVAPADDEMYTESYVLTAGAWVRK